MSGNENQFAVQVAVSGVPARLAYSLPAKDQAAAVGSEVTVEVGRRFAKGWIVGHIPLQEALDEILTNQRKQSEERRRLNSVSGQHQLEFFHGDIEQRVPVLKPLPAEISPAFLPEQLPLFEWMANYYGCSLAEVIEVALPKKFDGKKTSRVFPAPASALREEESAPLEKQRKSSPLHDQILALLQSRSGGVPPAEIKALGSSAGRALQSLLKKGLAVEKETAEENEAERVSNDPLVFAGTCPESLTPGQTQALEVLSRAVSARLFAPHLLFGVTGSGKTEIYLRLSEQVLREGGSALIIVPEIALTPQLFDQFKSRLKSPLAVLHSQVGGTSRWRAWKSLLSGKARIAIGARSAVFAPLHNLRLIIVDEEHEASYKQSEGLRYNGRDVAIVRAKLTACPIILGSATPSFESLLNAQRQRYELIELPDRATTRARPEIEIVDLSRIKRKEMISENFSPVLHQAISDTLAAKGQVVILYNKRGFSSYLQCDTCQEVVHCPNCSVSLTYHRRDHQLLCHYCGISLAPPISCAFCRNPETTKVEFGPDGTPLESAKAVEKVGKLSHRGSGTEKVVDELTVLYPKATILQMDRDTVRRKEAYREILGTMRTGQADILVGTQMIAKGHDLPGVTLVGIINADIGLHLPDFRCSEKAFQLITQAAGRAGRGSEKGRVIVQTREPNHPAIVATVTNRFKAFARYELDYRKKLEYPPYSRLLRLIVSSPDSHDAMQGAILTRKAIEELQSGLGSAIRILGPAPAPHEKLRARYRWHILVKAVSATPLSALARALYSWRDGTKNLKDFRLSIDIDPLEML